MENKLLTRECPVCSSLKQQEILNLKCGRVDDSPIYENVVIKKCDSCGHIFNELYEKDFEGLLKYYNEEYALTNLSAPDKTGDRPGSVSKNSLNRFEYLYSLTKDYLNIDTNVLDIGCAMGGFLEYLKTNGLKNLNGIDFTKDFVEYSKNNKFLNIKLGSADNIPFEENTFDILYMDQVLEHLVKPQLAFKEAKRVLKEGGYFCLGVPNSINYSKNYIFDFFWFLMKEHIQHFDIHHLEILANKEGFELVDFKFNNTPMMSDSTFLPNLNAVFKLTNKNIGIRDDNAKFELALEIDNYLNNEFDKLNKKKEIISKIKQSGNELYIWGIGREFLYLKENTDLSGCKIKALIDGNSYKREQLTIDGIKIQDPKILSNTTKDSKLIITASSYFNKLKSISRELGFNGEIIEI